MRRVRRTFLHHGLDAGGALVAIDEVERGRTSLGCPYCRVGLIARKGRVLAPHFAHDGPTCRESAERHASHIPFYDDLEPPGLGRQDLRLLSLTLRSGYINESSQRGWRRAALGRLVGARVLEVVPRTERWVDGTGSHRHTAYGEQLGQALRYRLDLATLAHLQEQAMLTKLAALEAGAGDAGGQVDLLLYRAQLARVLALDLYLLEVEFDHGVLHKIGVTSRGIEARLPEIRADLAPHLGEVELRVQNVWRHRGALELYFKQAFAKQRAEVGPLTEYFALRGRKPFQWLGKLDSWTLPPRLEKLLGA